MIVDSDNISVGVTSAHIFRQTDSNIFVVCPYVDLCAVLKENNLVAFGVGFHNFLWGCAVCVPLVCIVAQYRQLPTSKVLKNH